MLHPLPNATFLSPQKSHKVGKFMEEKESKETDGRKRPRKLMRKRCVTHMIAKTFGFYLPIP
jgi:hypothetical protein